MLFENASQFQKAKQTLLENDRDINKTARILKNSPLFIDLSEGELISQLTELNEGLGDTIMNFLSSAFGGDISKLKTVLTQMKEQELKYNREEYQIWDEFYRLLEDQKALDKDRNNPNYQSLNRELQQSRNSLNLRLKELTKTHNEIFNALEERVRDLTKDSARKKTYFNAQRANDILETRTDRYEKQKAITARSSSRSKELEDFFNVSLSDLEKERNEAERKAKEQEEKLRRQTTTSNENPHDVEEPSQMVEKYKKKLKDISDFPGDIHYTKIRKLGDLQHEIVDVISDDNAKITSEKPHGDLGKDVRDELVRISNELTIKIRDLVKSKDAKITAEEAEEAAKNITSRKK
jgi:hypothetical protein